LIISTDSKEIQENAKSYGVEVPFTRPAQLATDTASSVDVIAHAMEWIEENTGEDYDAVMLLEPSSPLTRSFDYDNAVAFMEEHNANVVAGIRETAINPMFLGPTDQQDLITQVSNQIRDKENTRRQGVAKEYAMNGGLYLFRWDFFKKHKKIYNDPDNTYGYLMDRHHSIEMDEPIDLQ